MEELRGWEKGENLVESRVQVQGIINDNHNDNEKYQEQESSYYSLYSALYTRILKMNP